MDDSTLYAKRTHTFSGIGKQQHVDIRPLRSCFVSHSCPVHPFSSWPLSFSQLCNICAWQTSNSRLPSAPEASWCQLAARLYETVFSFHQFMLHMVLSIFFKKNWIQGSVSVWKKVCGTRYQWKRVPYHTNFFYMLGQKNNLSSSFSLIIFKNLQLT